MQRRLQAFPGYREALQLEMAELLVWWHNDNEGQGGRLGGQHQGKEPEFPLLTWEIGREFARILRHY
ncbi:unnamed protein product, partial [Amoebophrya sp. A25]|eukprot:GSA25T00003524001.1